MTTRSKKLTAVFDITEQPVPVRGRDPKDGTNMLTAIHEDICRLMCETASATHAAGEQSRQHRDEMRGHLLSLLEVADAFERVFANIEKRKGELTKSTRAWISNFRAIRRLLGRVLGDQGVTQIENLDQGFDPHWHKVAETVDDPTKQDGTIVGESVRGYVWHGELLRKCEVVVVRSNEESKDLSE